MKAETKTLIYFNCLCCNNIVEVQSLDKVKETEHLCKDCRRLNVREYELVLKCKAVRST